MRSSLSRPCSGNFWIFPRMEIPAPLWVPVPLIALVLEMFSQESLANQLLTFGDSHVRSHCGRKAEHGFQGQESLRATSCRDGQCRMTNSRGDRPRDTHRTGGLKCCHCQFTQLLPTRGVNYKITGSTWALLPWLWRGRQLEPALVMN